MGFDLATGKMTWQATSKAGVQNRFSLDTRFAYSADGKALAVAAGSDEVGLRSTANGKLVAMANLPKGNNDPLCHVWI